MQEERRLLSAHGAKSDAAAAAGLTAAAAVAAVREAEEARAADIARRLEEATAELVVGREAIAELGARVEVLCLQLAYVAL